MRENNIKDPWSVTVEENNIGAPISIDDGGGRGFESGYDNLSSFTITGSRINIPKTVGCWKINESFHVHVVKRPNRLNRAMTRFLLGWEWMDT